MSTVPIPTYRRPAGDSETKKGGRECDKVIRSLVSGFPNEVDFALNVLTMMSFDKPESVPVAKVMLHVHVHVHVCTWSCCYMYDIVHVHSISNMYVCVIVCINQSF